MIRIQRIRDRLLPLKESLLNHPVYREIDRVEALRLFMEHHVFAVWDFMSLLKTLQRRLSCVEVPWLPSTHTLGSRLINEIVLAEESDEDGRGGFGSHFELYHRAMIQCGADTTCIDTFLGKIREGASPSAALEAVEVAGSIRRFVRHTFRVIEEGNLCAVASAFTFGREDLLPVLFERVVEKLLANQAGREDFLYYLRRHIGLDGDEHGPMASRLLISLCGSDEENWEAAEQAARNSLEARGVLWDGIHGAIRQEKVSCAL